MSEPAKNLSPQNGMNVAAWLPRQLANIFRRHVRAERGNASKFAVAAIEEKLRREGAFADEHSAQALALLKNVSTESLPVVVAFAELLETRGAKAVEAKLAELKDEEIAAAAGGA